VTFEGGVERVKREEPSQRKKEDIQIQKLKLDQESVVVASASENTVPDLRKTT